MGIQSQLTRAVQRAAETAGTTMSTQEAQKAATAANQKRWWKTNYPWASNLNTAQHIDYFITNPKNFVNDVLATYDNLDGDLPASYARDIAAYMSELNINNNTLLQEKLSLVPTGPLGQFTVKIWPELTDYFWLRWANDDLNAFLSEHLKNLAAIPLSDRKLHVNYFTDWLRRTGVDVNAAREDLREKFIQVMFKDFEPGGGSQAQAAAAPEDSPGAKLLMGGLLLGGILWGVTAMSKKQKKRSLNARK